MRVLVAYVVLLAWVTGCVTPTQRLLWEVKTDNFDAYSPYVRKIAAAKEAKEMGRERALAAACGYSFKVGVKSAAHMSALLEQDQDLEIVIMDWC